MPFAAASSTLASTEQAFRQVCDEAISRLPDPELAVVFFSPHHLEEICEIAPALANRLSVNRLLGCVGESIVGGAAEIENAPAVSIWLAKWSGAVEIEPFHLTVEQTPDGWSLLGWPDSLLETDPTSAMMLVLGDPYSFPADKLFLPRINQDHSGLRVIGGMASGMPGPASNVLLNHSEMISDGAVGVLLQGPVNVRSVVSQGCRPIGKPFVVTKCQDNIILGLGGKTPLEQLRELWPQLSPRDRDLFQRGPQIGLVFNEYQEKFERGDFLVRNIAGLDSNSGAIAVMDFVRVGQTVQFQVRDADAADEDLHVMLARDREQNGVADGALLFTCNGRGTRLFGVPNHDADAVQCQIGNIPLAGLFCAGEFGPIAGRNFVHGFTASVALFRD